jgi:hypothetical protein
MKTLSLSRSNYASSTYGDVNSNPSRARPVKDKAYHHRLHPLGALDIDGLNVRKQPVLRTLLVVTLARNANAKSVRHTLDTLLPDLLVELGVETDVFGSLFPRQLVLTQFHNPSVPSSHQSP